MKTKLFSLAILFIAISTYPQNSPEEAANAAASNEASAENVQVSTGTGATYSLDQVAVQLRKLHSVVEETLPMLNAVTETHSNSLTQGKQTTAGAIAGVLGNILNRTTNSATTTSTSGNTNILGSIVRGVLGTNTTASTSGNANMISDLKTLRDQLQSMTPVLARLDSGSVSTNQLAAPSNDGSTNNLTPTGRTRGYDPYQEKNDQSNDSQPDE